MSYLVRKVTRTKWLIELADNPYDIQLTDIALRDNLNFDLIVAAPQKPELTDAYQAVFEVFEGLKCPKRIIKAHEIPAYIKNASGEMQSLKTKTSIAA